MKRIFGVFAFLLLAVPAFSATIPISGTVRLANGNLLNGSVRFTLNYSAGRDSCSSNVIVAQTVTFRIANGTLPGAARITPNDCIQPANTTYTAQYLTVTGQVFAQNVFYIQGSSFDIGAATPTPLTTSNISFGTFTGLTSVGSAKFTVTANGTKTVPTITNSNFPTSGIYWETGNSTNIFTTIDGVPMFNINSYGIAVTDTLGEGAAAQLHLSSSPSVPFAWTTAGIALRIDPDTYTDQASTGTVGAVNISVIDRPTIAATHAVTYTNAQTLYIDGPPIAGTNVTLTNPYSLVIGSGAVNFPGISFSSSGIVTGPSGTNSAPTFSFVADPDTGAYRDTTNTYAIAAGGTQAAKWTATVQTNPGSFVTTTTGPNVLIADSGTTGGLLQDFSNTGGQSRFGVESSAGGSMFSGSAAYTTVLGSIANRAVQIFTHNVLALTLDTSQNATFAGTASFSSGGTAVFRCTSAGAARSGTLTTVSADCGTSSDTGIRIP